nr:substrate-binding domain-containing protein [uncultured Treponema sp.]
MAEPKKRKTLAIFSLIVFLISIVVCFIIVVYNLASIQSQSNVNAVQGAQRDYSVLITGNSENKFILRHVYEGATIVGNFYDSAIQYYIPESKTRSTSMQSLFDYASYTNADCVIAYIDPDVEDFIPPVNSSGEKIPIITVGTYSPEISQISHIGVNYAELGASMAQEAAEFLNGTGTIYILNTLNIQDFYNSTFINSLYNALKAYGDINVLNSRISKNSGFTIEDSVRQQIASTGQIDLILSLSEQDTVLAAQTILDLNMGANTKIIGFGNGYESNLYFEKGIVAELFKVDAVDIGKKAVHEFFEYNTNGSANSYVTADIQLLKIRMDK